MTDNDTHTTYIGDSVYVAVEPGVNPRFSIFLNNGERESPLQILRKSEIIIEDHHEISRLIVFLFDHSSELTRAKIKRIIAQSK